MKKSIALLSFFVASLLVNQQIQAQSLLGTLQQGARVAKTAAEKSKNNKNNSASSTTQSSQSSQTNNYNSSSSNSNSNTNSNTQSYTNSTQSSNSDYNQNVVEDRNNSEAKSKNETAKINVGKIHFVKGSVNPRVDPSQYVKSIDLSSPCYMIADLDLPIATIRKQVNQNDLLVPEMSKRYYINGELIADYSDPIDDYIFSSSDRIPEVIVPSDPYEYDANKMRMGVWAHIFSNLGTGTYKLKVEVYIVKNIPYEVPGEAGYRYNNEDVVIATGEVELKTDANLVNKYAKDYGRPKFSKGVLQGQSGLEAQVKSLIQTQRNETPIYIYADDKWDIKRGAFDRIISREVRLYYIVKTPSGRCELKDFNLTQDFNGSSYEAPFMGVRKFGLPFKFVVCQNYQ